MIGQDPLLQTSSLQVPPQEEQLAALTIKQKAAELTRKTRNSFRRKNTSSSSHAGRKILLPRERISKNNSSENKKNEVIEANSFGK